MKHNKLVIILICILALIIFINNQTKTKEFKKVAITNLITREVSNPTPISGEVVTVTLRVVLTDTDSSANEWFHIDENAPSWTYNKGTFNYNAGLNLLQKAQLDQSAGTYTYTYTVTAPSSGTLTFSGTYEVGEGVNTGGIKSVGGTPSITVVTSQTCTSAGFHCCSSPNVCTDIKLGYTGCSGTCCGSPGACTIQGVSTQITREVSNPTPISGEVVTVTLRVVLTDTDSSANEWFHIDENAPSWTYNKGTFNYNAGLNLLQKAQLDQSAGTYTYTYTVTAPSSGTLTFSGTCEVGEGVNTGGIKSVGGTPSITVTPSPQCSGTCYAGACSDYTSCTSATGTCTSGQSCCSGTCTITQTCTQAGFYCCPSGNTCSSPRSNTGCATGQTCCESSSSSVCSAPSYTCNQLDSRASCQSAPCDALNMTLVPGSGSSCPGGANTCCKPRSTRGGDGAGFGSYIGIFFGLIALVVVSKLLKN